MHAWNVATDVPCSSEGDRRCEVYPCSNALYPEKTEVRRSVWLPQVVQAAKPSRRRRQVREELGEGVFAREDIVEGTFVLDFGELREASSKERSVGWKGWSVRLQVETSLCVQDVCGEGGPRRPA